MIPQRVVFVTTFCYNVNMSNQYALMNSKKSAERQLTIAKRRAILMRLIEKQKDNNWTFEEIAEKMRSDPWVAARWPDYVHSTAHRDFVNSMDLVRDDIKELAMPYFVRQVDTADSVIDTLKDFIGDDQLAPKTRIDAANSLRGYLDQLGKVFGNYAPKEMHVKKMDLSINLDTYVEMKKRVEKELEEQSNVIDGEVTEQE